jgi:hypothetical protein
MTELNVSKKFLHNFTQILKILRKIPIKHKTMLLSKDIFLAKSHFCYKDTSFLLFQEEAHPPFFVALQKMAHEKCNVAQPLFLFLKYPFLDFPLISQAFFVVAQTS